MTTPREQLVEPGEPGSLVPAALGLVSCCAALESALLRSVDGPGRPASALAPDDPILLAALGALSLRRRLLRWLRQELPPQAEREAAPEAAWPPPGALR